MANMQNLTLVTQMPTVHGMPRVGGLVGERGGWAVDCRSNNPTNRRLQSPSSQDRCLILLVTLELCKVRGH